METNNLSMMHVSSAEYQARTGTCMAFLHKVLVLLLSQWRWRTVHTTMATTVPFLWLAKQALLWLTMQAM